MENVLKFFQNEKLVSIMCIIRECFSYCGTSMEIFDQMHRIFANFQWRSHRYIISKSLYDILNLLLFNALFVVVFSENYLTISKKHLIDKFSLLIGMNWAVFVY